MRGKVCKLRRKIPEAFFFMKGRAVCMMQCYVKEYQVAREKKEENWFLVIQKGWGVFVKVQASLIKHSFGAMLFVSHWRTLILYSSVTFAFNLLNFHWLKSRWDLHSLCMCLSVNCRVCCVAPSWEFAEDECTRRLLPWFFLFLQR